MKLKEFIPPIIVNSVKRLQKSSKVYHSYEEAVKQCSSNAYQNIELCNIVAEKTNKYKETILKGPFHLTNVQAFSATAFAKSLTVLSKNHLTILDFGGACGAHYFEIKQLLPDVSFNWIVVETPQMVKSALDYKLNSSELSFTDSLDKVNVSIDMIHSSGTLQYVPDPFAFLKDLIQKKPNALFFNRMIFTSNLENIITIQSSLLSENGPGELPGKYKDDRIKYPHTTIAFNMFNNILIDNGYRLDMTFEETSGIYKNNQTNIFGRGLMYSKVN